MKRIKRKKKLWDNVANKKGTQERRHEKKKRKKKKEGKEGGREGREVSWISGAVLQRDTSAF